jgi:hypothetical protein
VELQARTSSFEKNRMESTIEAEKNTFFTAQNTIILACL